METEGQGTGAGTTGTGNQPGVTPPAQPPASSGVTPPQTPPPATGNQSHEIPEGDVNALPAWAKTLVQNLRQSERKLRQFEERDKTELQKAQDEAARLQGELDKAQGTIRDHRLSSVFADAATKAGAIDSTLLYSVAKDQIKTGSDGQPTNLDEVVKNLKAAHPTQFRAVRQVPGVDAGAGTGNANAGGTGGTGSGTGVSVTGWMRDQVRPGMQ